MRLVQAYLSGSTTNEIPYEVIYCLGDALERWEKRETIILTQLTEGHNFHFLPIDPWQFIQKALTGFDSSGFDALLVLIGVPKLYAHKPLFCIPLYHELGHFVDITFKVSELSLLLGLTPVAQPTALQHRREHFADLFSSCFVGRAGISALETIAPNHPASPTHPSTGDRASTVDAFIDGSPHATVSLFQQALKIRALPPLSKFYDQVSVADAFDDLCTFSPLTTEAMHGMLESAWIYMFDSIDNHRNPWQIDTLSDGVLETLVNDLTEKSIRNFAIKRAWDATSNP